MKFVPTHKGWFSFVPIYASDPNGECNIEGRFGLGFLIPAACAMQDFANWVIGFIDPYREPFFILKLWPIPEKRS